MYSYHPAYMQQQTIDGTTVANVHTHTYMLDDLFVDDEPMHMSFIKINKIYTKCYL